MSYLSNNLRLHFAGCFQASVSTVNNDVTHFDNAAFQPNFQERQTKLAPNGWWNPSGDGVWRLLGCAVTSAFMPDGTPVPNTDGVLATSVADSDESAPAKIVDLDPQQQMVSTIFGLQVRIADASGNTLMRGNFDPAAFTELWGKIQGGQGGDMAFGAMWQSVVTVTEWGDVSASPFLLALQASAAANQNLLSMKFNVDCYSMSWPVPGTPGSDQFCRGRLVGTLGPASVAEPRHFVLGRQLMVLQSDANQNPLINYCAAVVDTTAGVIRLDLGNALRVDSSGTVMNMGALNLVVTPQGANAPVVIGEIDYTAANWYQNTAGVVEVPLPTNLVAVVASNPLGLTMANLGTGVLTGEVPASTANGINYPGGLYVRADLFVFRLSPNEAANVNFYATCYGQPYTGQVISLGLDPNGLQGGTGDPDVGTPAGGISFPASLTTDLNGQATLTLTGGNTQNSRGYIDGQIYGVGYILTTQSPSYPPNPWNFISALVFDAFTPDSPPTWHGSMQPIFQQYANLYPVMLRFIDLGNLQQVLGYTNMLQLAFGLPIEDPNCMPVTRDLSPAKRTAILEWLSNPLEGTPPAATPSLAVKALATPPPALAAAAAKGGKSAAMARRIGQRP